MIPCWVWQKLRRVEECLPWQPSRRDLQNHYPTGLVVPLSSLSCCPTCTPLLLHGGAQQQPHHLLTLPSASSFLLSHCGSNKGCSLLRGISLICQTFSTTNAYVCAVSNSAVSSQTILVHQGRGPNKLEHQNQGRNRDSLKGWQRHRALWQNWPCLRGIIIMLVATAFIFPHLYSLLHQEVLPKGSEHVAFTT